MSIQYKYRCPSCQHVNYAPALHRVGGLIDCGKCGEKITYESLPKKGEK
jgi:DNA-directed RNA polymerase subunit RPC12/RpoP